MNKHADYRNPGYSSLRKGRASIHGQTYLVTFTTSARSELFLDYEIASTAAIAMTNARHWLDSALLAWVLMPDHWHGVIELGRHETLSAQIQKLKANSARRIRIAHPNIGTVWEKGFQDRALRTEEALQNCARYIVLNPVRAGLVRRVGDYPFWNAIWI